MFPAPSRDRGLPVLQVPLQGPPALGAAPAAVVLAWGEQSLPVLKQLFLQLQQLSTDLGRCSSGRWL